MSSETEKLFREAMALPREELQSLVERLLAALPREGTPGELEEEWNAEAVDRAEAYERGELSTLDASEALAEIRARRASSRE
jgi:putative addiction module component (TIGR02574 family)